MPGVSRNNPLLRDINEAAAQRGTVGRGAPPISTLLQNQATGERNESILGGTVIGTVPVTGPEAADNSQSILGGLAPGDFSSRVAPPDGVFGGANPIVAPTSAGVGANDDSGAASRQAAGELAMGGYSGGREDLAGQDSTDAESQAGGFYGNAGVFNGLTRPLIVPQDNVLDKFSSYTYQISVYVLTPNQYERLILSSRKTINGYNLLFQSGGAPANTGGFQAALAPGSQTLFENNGTASTTTGAPTTAQADAGRNPAFPLDFYIQDCVITNLMQGKGTGLAHSAASMKFTVIEPVGITLIDRIYQAVQDIAPTNAQGKVNYANAQYLMVIRWFGYDQNGNMVGGSANNTDPRAAVEKFIPFVINKINWRVQTKATEYEFDCTPVGQTVAGGTRRGVVPYDIQLSAGTVGAILAGNLQFVDRTTAAQNPGATTTVVTEPAINPETGQIFQRAVAPSKANAATTNRPVVKQGLMAAMNDFSQSLAKGDGNRQPIYEFADQYEIVFAPGAEAIRDATIVISDRKLTPMAQGAANTPSSLNPATGRVDTTVNTKSIYAGQPIVQVIDQVIRNSSYITNQALTKYDQDQEQPNDENRKPKKPVDWYRINFEAIPIGNQQDSRRNDYAYKIRYVISPYRLDYYDSKYFPVGIFRGVHKSYNWIFTGKNTAIIDYSETLNTAYNMLVSGSDPTNSAAETERRKVAATLRELITYTYGPGSSESRQGSRYKDNEVSANIADSLYGGADLANTKLTIVGDPAWLQQGSLAGNVLEQISLPSSFLPDGTINFDAEQVCFEVAWRRPSDYDLQTGVTDAGQQAPPVSRVYIASKVTNNFRQGQFTQVIDGLLFALPKPDGTNKALTAAMPNQTQAETARLERQNSAAAVGGAAGSALPAPPTGVPSTAPAPNQTTTVSTPADSAQPSPPPAAPSSNGDVNINALPGADAAGLGFPAPPAVGRFTAQESGAALSASGDNVITIVVTGVGNSAPAQDIVRDP